MWNFMDPNSDQAKIFYNSDPIHTASGTQVYQLRFSTNSISAFSVYVNRLEHARCLCGLHDSHCTVTKRKLENRMPIFFMRGKQLEVAS